MRKRDFKPLLELADDEIGGRPRSGLERATVRIVCIVRMKVVKPPDIESGRKRASVNSGPGGYVQMPSRRGVARKVFVAQSQRFGEAVGLQFVPHQVWLELERRPFFAHLEAWIVELLQRGRHLKRSVAPVLLLEDTSLPILRVLRE